MRTELPNRAWQSGTPVTVFQTGVPPSGLSWENEGIVFSQSSATIMRVSQNSNKPVLLNKPEVILDLGNSDDGVFGPQLLPDGGTLLFTIAKRTNAAINRWDESQIVVQSSEGVRKVLLKGGGVVPRAVEIQRRFG